MGPFASPKPLQGPSLSCFQILWCTKYKVVKRKYACIYLFSILFHGLFIHSFIHHICPSSKRTLHYYCASMVCIVQKEFMCQMQCPSDASQHFYLHRIPFLFSCLPTPTLSLFPKLFSCQVGMFLPPGPSPLTHLVTLEDPALMLITFLSSIFTLFYLICFSFSFWTNPGDCCLLTD